MMMQCASLSLLQRRPWNFIIIITALLFPKLDAFMHSTTTTQSASASTTCLSAGNLQEKEINLDSGVNMQVLFMKGEIKRPVLLFLHGSFHGAWCWSEHFFEFFNDLGYTVVAPSWRGTGGTFAGEGVRKVKIQEHVADLEGFLNQLPDVIGVDLPTPPIVISHSFGGLAVMKYLEKHNDAKSMFSGIASMCVVPPSGNGKMTMRYLQRSLKDSWKITKGFAMKGCLKDKNLCRELFFGGPKQTLSDGSVQDFGLSDDDVNRYQFYFARDSEATIDLVDFAKQLPSAQAIDGKAAFLNMLPPCLVLGASDDFIVDMVGLEETALYYGTSVVMVDSPHDVMLGAKWKHAADQLKAWIATVKCE